MTMMYENGMLKYKLLYTTLLNADKYHSLEKLWIVILTTISIEIVIAL